MDKFKESFPFSAAPPIAILGVPFDNVSTSETITLIQRMVASRRPHYLATANVDFLVQASQDVELRRILFDAHLVLCDGTPLLWASRLLGNPLAERVAGSDLVPLLLETAEKEGFRPFFLGATPDTIEKAVENVRQKHPGIDIAGYYSPPFNRLLEMDHEEIKKRVLAARPDLLFVGFGCPKQEKWINMHYRSLGVPVSVGVGATIDFLAGKMARAPVWMQKSGTEWIFRLGQEPRRLLGRYSKDLLHFSRAFAAQYWRLQSRRKKVVRPADPPAPPARGLEYAIIRMPERLDYEAVEAERERFESSVSAERPCIVDLTGVEFIDSTGVGLLIRLRKRARLQGRQLVLAGAEKNTLRALELMRLRDFFEMAPDLPAAEKRLNEERAPAAVDFEDAPGSAPPTLAWRGELTAANAEEIWTATADYLGARAAARQPVTIDLSGVTFMDSTGLSILIRAKKQAAREGVKLRFAGAGANVLNVVKLSRLEDYLFAEKA